MAYLGISRLAAHDIQEIYDYSVEQWGPQVAEEYLDAIQEALNRLRASPDLLRVKPEFSPHLYFHRVRRHFLVCSLLEGNIYILTVKHGSLDLPKRLAELEPQLSEEVNLLHKAFVAATRDMGD
jgi:toxin ParE1/3/4